MGVCGTAKKDTHELDQDCHAVLVTFLQEAGHLKFMCHENMK